ncbi:MAG: type II secretion system F family protein [Acidimicrobiales bacterium]
MAVVLAMASALVPVVWADPNRPNPKPRTRSAQHRVPVVAAAVVVGVVALPLPVLLILPLVWAVNPLIAMASSHRQRRAMAAAFPETLEIIALSISVEMSIDEMIDLVARCGPQPIRPLFVAARRSLTAGHSRRQALRQLASQGGPPMAAACDVLIAADRDGASVALVLDRLAAEAGRAHRLAADERARRAPVLMLAPLTLCSLPAVLIGTVLPFILLSFGQTSF